MSRRNSALLAAMLALVVLLCGSARVAAATPSTSPEVYSNTMLASMSIQRQFAQTLPSVADYSQTAHQQMYTDENCDVTSKNWVMWDTPWMHFENQRGGNEHSGYDAHSSGFATGFGKLFGPSATLGVAVGYDFRKLTGRDGIGVEDRADAFHSALYGGASFGCLFLDSYAGYSYTRHRANRAGTDAANPFMGGNPDYSVGANYSEDIWSAGVKASYVVSLPGDVRFVPSVGMEYSHVRRRGFVEHEKDSAAFGPAALAVNQSTFNNVEMPIMMSLNRTFQSDFLSFGGSPSRWTPEVRGGWIPQFGSREARTNSMYTTSGNTMNVFADSSEMARSFGSVGADLKIQIRDKYIFGVDYGYTFASDYGLHVVTGTYGVSF